MLGRAGRRFGASLVIWRGFGSCSLPLALGLCVVFWLLEAGGPLFSREHVECQDGQEMGCGDATAASWCTCGGRLSLPTGSFGTGFRRALHYHVQNPAPLHCMLHRLILCGLTRRPGPKIKNTDERLDLSRPYRRTEIDCRLPKTPDASSSKSAEVSRIQAGRKRWPKKESAYLQHQLTSASVEWAATMSGPPRSACGAGWL